MADRTHTNYSVIEILPAGTRRARFVFNGHLLKPEVAKAKAEAKADYLRSSGCTVEVLAIENQPR